MNLSTLNPKGLTASQKRNLAALIAGAALSLNEHWPQITALVGEHYHGLPIPPAVTLALQLVALGMTSLSRALNRAKSGTGTGIVGSAPDEAAEAAVQTSTDTNWTPDNPASPAGAAVAGRTGHSAPSPIPFVPTVDDFLAVLLPRLSPVKQQEAKAFVAQLVADAEKAAALNLSQQLSRADLAPAPPASPAPVDPPLPTVVSIPTVFTVPPPLVAQPAFSPPNGSLAPSGDNSGVIAAPDPNAQTEPMPDPIPRGTGDITSDPPTTPFSQE